MWCVLPNEKSAHVGYNGKSTLSCCTWLLTHFTVSNVNQHIGICTMLYCNVILQCKNGFDQSRQLLLLLIKAFFHGSLVFRGTSTIIIWNHHGIKKKLLFFITLIERALWINAFCCSFSVKKPRFTQQFTVEALWADTLVSRQLYLRPPSQNLVWITHSVHIPVSSHRYFWGVKFGLFCCF